MSASMSASRCAWLSSGCAGLLHGVDQFDADMVAYVETFEPALQLTFARWLEEPDPRDFVQTDGAAKMFRGRIANIAGRAADNLTPFGVTV